MSIISRTWVAFAAIGTGLIHIALVIGSPPWLAIPLGVLGVLEGGWGVSVFVRDQLSAPRTVMVVALAPLAGWGLLEAAASTRQGEALANVLDVVPWGIAAIFQLFVAGALARNFRNTRGSNSSVPTASSAARYVTAVAIGAVLATMLTLTALAATDTGLEAPPPGAPDGETVDDLFNIPGHGNH